MKYYSEQISEYITQLRFEDLSAKVVEHAKWTILDALGIAIGCFDTPWAMSLYRGVCEKSSLPESTILYFGNKISDMDAALVNSMFIQSMDFNDELSGIHTGAIVPPAALAVSESLDASGKDFITALVIGYDIAGRVAEASGAQGLFERGFQPSSILGAFASAAVYCKLHDMETAQICSAFGIAGGYAGGTIEFLKDGTDTKRFNIAKATQSGIFSAFLAKKGLTGPGSIFEGENGVLRLFSTNPDPIKLISDLGSRFDILQTSIKKYPTCDGCFCPLDAALAIKREHALAISEIKEINFRIKSFLVPFLVDYHGDSHRKYNPLNTTDAQLSLPFVIALGLLKDGDIRISDFNDINYHNPKILSLASKVGAVPDKELDKQPFRPMSMPAIATIKMKNGEVYRKRVDYHRGDPRKPFADKDYIKKFRSNTEGKLKNDSIDKVIDQIANLEKVDDLSSLVKLLIKDSIITS